MRAKAVHINCSKPSTNPSTKDMGFTLWRLEVYWIGYRGTWWFFRRGYRKFYFTSLIGPVSITLYRNTHALHSQK